MKKIFTILISLAFIVGCDLNNKPLGEHKAIKPPFLWENVTIYFLLTDRFYNGNRENDVNFDRTGETVAMRGFQGGDIAGITQKIEDGYFTDLGVTAIWFTPVVEQIHGIVDEGTGNTYGYHGYWTKDWTAIDPNFGNEADLSRLVEAAHSRGIRIVLDVVLNHTGPVTDVDPQWPDSWVRTEPQCTYQNMESTVSCTLVKNLPDVRTETNESVELPQFLLDKWKSEGRLEKELKELDDFFSRTGYPRAPKYYIIKWLTDYIRKYGVDGFRVDTAKHTEASVWADLYSEAVAAFKRWKETNPEKVLDQNDFFMMGEVYGYNISSGRLYDYGDQKVDFFENSFHSLINFQFKEDAKNDFEAIFSKYDQQLSSSLKGKSVVNYLASHDDGSPFDINRENPMDAGTKLLLSPGIAQIYYGDETSRPLVIEGANGDANLRSFMNWDELLQNQQRGGFEIKTVLAHWQKLGRFRAEHPAIGAGKHAMISTTPYFFSRTYESAGYSDKVLVGLDLETGEKTIPATGTFSDGQSVLDSYSGQTGVVVSGQIVLDTPFSIVLISAK